jgi:hypothetical protein
MKVGQALEYLSQVLSQRGPQAVPYEEGAKWKIRDHLSELLKVRAQAREAATAGWGNDSSCMVNGLAPFCRACVSQMHLLNAIWQVLGLYFAVVHPGRDCIECEEQCTAAPCAEAVGAYICSHQHNMASMLITLL